ncbi:MAG: formate C-acetyltransferase/glycerol dehydratase family glycyl radical enzyme [Spirochaetia bacterium]|jgi:formate C-acetyltransferase
MREYVAEIERLPLNGRFEQLKREMLAEPRFLSIEQAGIITRVYRETEGEPVIIRRARSLQACLSEMKIRIDPEELIVGNRTAGVRAGVVFPEAGISWVDKEIEQLPTREQDRFNVRTEDVRTFRDEILPYWSGHTLEDAIRREIGPEIDAIARVVKINQKDHAQGHICPDAEGWLRLGPAGLQREAEERARTRGDPDRFFEAVILSLEGARTFMRRYAALARELASRPAGTADEELAGVARICDGLADRPPRTFREALQSVWFLFVILHMESNASSFSPGRMDQYLYPYVRADLDSGALDLPGALELVSALWLKFNQIVYLRNSNSAKYFAGFPIGFNVALGGQDGAGRDASNELSFLFLRAQELIGLSQPNLSARLFEGSPDDLLMACSRVIGRGSGMPQVFSDQAVIPALRGVGITEADARNYAIVGCVELTTHGNNLGWSDAAMFNLVKALELTLTGGFCLVDRKPLGLNLGKLTDFHTFEQLEAAFARQIEHFTGRMIRCCDTVDRIHGELLPTPFLSSVIRDCIDTGVDVTRGGAHYNLSGIQAIQPANVADSLAALKKLVYEEKVVTAEEVLRGMETDFESDRILRHRLVNKAPKYGNDVEWVDELAHTWVRVFAEGLRKYTNHRGGRYHTGLYTVSAHVPMGQNVGATPDGRRARTPLADGGMSALYGRDMNGPTAVLNSVARVDSKLGSNGTLLNLKFSPELFADARGLKAFSQFLRAFVRLKISHVQFNVINEADLRAARENPDRYRNLTVRVAGYTAYYTELAADLQEEIIERTTHALSS